MASFLIIFNMLVEIVFWIIIIQAVLSWLVAFDIVNLRQRVVYQIWTGLNRLTEPLYRPIRRMLPDMGGFDVSPLVVIFLLFVLQTIVNNNLGPYAFS